MANVAHATLSGASLHEPKGVASATLGQAYLADGAGSGAWTTVAGLTITGMIADFITPVAPSGWLEADGTNISRATYSALFAAETIQQSGTRSAGTATITSLASTTNMRAGYYVSGTGITVGTTVLSVDSPTQVTLSANAISSGTNTVVCSPWGLGDGSTTFTLPNVSTSSRFRRSRGAGNQIGLLQGDQNRTHTHAVSGSGTVGASGAHTHGINDPGHVHDPVGGGNFVANSGTGGLLNGGNGVGQGMTSSTTGISVVAVTDHTHTFSYSTTSGNGSADGAETRPAAIVVMTCVKT